MYSTQAAPLPPPSLYGAPPVSDNNNNGHYVHHNNGQQPGPPPAAYNHPSQYYPPPQAPSYGYAPAPAPQPPQQQWYAPAPAPSMPPHHSTVAGPSHYGQYAQPPPPLPPTAHPAHHSAYPPQQSYAPIPPAPNTNVQAIPAPAKKESYQAPVFKTFQERKREREAALRAASGSGGPATPPVNSPTAGTPGTPTRPGYFPPSAPTSMAPAPPPRAPVQAPYAPASPQRPRPANAAPVSPKRPVPPPRARTPSPSPAPTPALPPLPRPPAVTSPSVRAPATQPATSVMDRGRPKALPRPVSPLKRAPSPVRPASPVRAASPVRQAPAPLVPQRTGPVAAPAPPPPPAIPAHVAAAAAKNPALAALLDRSDTVSSTKSVDRPEFGSPSRRALPRPPQGVTASKSLNRGPGAPAADLEEFRRTLAGQRNSPPMTIIESPAELAARMANVKVGDVVPGSPPVSPVRDYQSLPSIVVPPSPPKVTPKVMPPSPPKPSGPKSKGAAPRTQPPLISVNGRAPPSPVIPTISIGEERMPSPPSISVSSVPTVNVPSIVVPSPPAISISVPEISVNVPEINVGCDDDDRHSQHSHSRPASPGFSFSGLPTIAVSSSSSYDESPTSSGPAISVSRPRPASPRGPAAAAPTRIEASSAILCAGCTQPIIGRIVRAMNHRWHPGCFKCGVCSELLEHVSAYEHDGKPYCHLDYHDRFAHRCHHCKTPIVDPRFITLDDDVLGQRFYHELHFFCSECGDPFLDPSKSSAPGTEFAPRQDDGETSDFVIHKGHPYCERCHLRLHKPKCKGCKKPIPDVALTALGSQWHAECFVCDHCTKPFANNLFFPSEDGKAFCTECYETM
ncbi:hypothetical protein Q8F55_004123 [Vanrija albida]|uniref:LIM zinc-binding domain-containing protein n=1 Tax=Vanrija albida TaxID=181172 RepID=A0ABR3Q659_9TREE